MVEPAVAAERVTSFLQEYRERAGASGYVVGVSGGLDSAVAATLAVDAVGPERVTGMVMPGAPSDPENMADARALCESLQITWHETDIEPLVADVRAAFPYEAAKETVGNLRARTRMALEYYEANHDDLLVLGPDNRSEYLLGYFTKYGDGAVDVAPLGELYKTEVYELARHVGLDERFVEKEPTAGLWEGQTDEAELGAPYETIDPVLRSLVEDGNTVAETVARTDADRATVERLADLWRGSEHKRAEPPTASMPRSGA